MRLRIELLDGGSIKYGTWMTRLHGWILMLLWVRFSRGFFRLCWVYICYVYILRIYVFMSLFYTLILPLGLELPLLIGKGSKQGRFRGSIEGATERISVQHQPYCFTMVRLLVYIIHILVCFAHLNPFPYIFLLCQH